MNYQIENPNGPDRNPNRKRIRDRFEIIKQIKSVYY